LDPNDPENGIEDVGFPDPEFNRHNYQLPKHDPKLNRNDRRERQPHRSKVPVQKVSRQD
jgi:hypothetical protein